MFYLVELPHLIQEGRLGFVPCELSDSLPPTSVICYDPQRSLSSVTTKDVTSGIPAIFRWQFPQNHV